MAPVHLLIAAAALVGPNVACDREPGAEAATAVPGVVQTAAHGDHTPRYGGVVFMHGDLHFEVVLATHGRYRVYFSDATRAELPASVASDVTVTITSGGADGRLLRASIDEAGESWIVEDRPIGDPLATARISFVSGGGPYFIDIPFAGVVP
jgi:hypothetical protein